MPLFSFELPVFQILKALYPISSVLQVGNATQLQQSHYAHLTASHVYRVYWSPETLPQDDSATTDLSISDHNILLSEKAEELVFHLASLPRESGLIEPERLVGLWKNLRSVGQRRVHAGTIAGFIDSSIGPSGHAQPNWLFVDVLPAAPIVRGANQYLSDFDVIVARVVLETADKPTLEEASKTALDDTICDSGWVQCAQIESQHPHIVHIVFARDFSKLKFDHTAALARESDLVATNTHQIEALARERDELRSSLANLEEAQCTKIDALNAELALTVEKADLADSNNAAEIAELSSTVKALSERNSAQEAIHADETAILRENIDKHEKERVALMQQVNLLETQLHQLQKELQAALQAEKKLLLSENNLQSLQGRFRKLTEKCDDQDRRLEHIAAELDAALNLIDADPPDVAPCLDS